MASILYAEIYLFCIIIVQLCLYWCTRSASDSASDRWLQRTLIGFSISFCANFLFTLFNGILHVDFAGHAVGYFFKTIYHGALCLGVFAWCGYADTVCRGNLFKSKARCLLAALPLFAMLAIIALNLFDHRLFELDGEGNYARNGLFHLEMGLLVAYTLVFGALLLRHAFNEADPIKRSHERLVSTFPVCLLLAWALTFLGESIPVICVTITLELLCLMMGSSTQQISMDKLTQVNNRQNLLGFLEFKLLSHDEKIFLLMMDLDYFKSINDTYGHLEGDDALVRAANALKLACGSSKRRPYIARYGGDEFIVVVESSKAEVDALVAGIREALNRLNAQAARPYTLAFSIGVSEYHPGMSANDLIEAADSALYEIKRARPPRVAS